MRLTGASFLSSTTPGEKDLRPLLAGGSNTTGDEHLLDEKGELARFAELAIFSEDVGVPVGVVAGAEPLAYAGHGCSACGAATSVIV